MIDLGALGFDLLLKKDGWEKDFKEADNDVETHQSKWKTMASNIGGGLKTAIVGGIAAIGVAVVGMGIAGVKSADELQKALNGIQAESGLADEMMVGMKDTMLSIYNNNFGDSFEDIGSAISEIKKQTGLAGKELEGMTTNALMLRDTFEIDVNASVNASTILMTNFGIDSNEAYNLMAQGAQYGLNKNEDLVDILSEYGPHFATLGFSAEEMFNMLVNGAGQGVFSVDQLGDVIHEFGRKMKEEDMSEPLTELGLNAKKYTDMVGQGGESAKLAFTEISQAIVAMDDPIKQSQMGIAVFGDMWGEVQADGVLAMTDLTGEISNSVDALGAINKIKYNTFGEAMEGIKRNLETGILLPLGDKILPVLGQFSNWITQHMPEIKNEIQFAMDAIGVVINGFINVIKNVIAIFQNWGSENTETIDAFRTMFSSFIDWSRDIFATFIEIIGSALEIIKILWDKYGNDFLNIIKPIFEAIKATISMVMNVIKDVINIILAIVKGDWEGAWNSVKQLFVDVWNGMANILPNLLSAIVNIIRLQFTVFKDIGKGLFNSVWDGMKEIWSGIENFVKNNVSWLKEKLSFWRSSNDEMEGGDGADGTHFNGLDYVPFDGYKAILHEGERILTKQENNSYNNSGKGLSLNIGTFINNRKQDVEALAQELGFYARQYELANGGT